MARYVRVSKGRELGTQAAVAKKRRMDGWTRVGIIASIIWAVGAWFYWTAHLATVASDAYSFSSRICYSIQSRGLNLTMKNVTSMLRSI